jgi:hypothetical protein
MGNKVVTDLKEVGEVLAWPFVHISRTVAVATVALKDYPAVRTAVVGLVQQVQITASDIGEAAAADELNPVLDGAELAASIALFNYVKATFLPQVDAAYNDEVAAATATAQANAAKAATASATALKAAKTRAANQTASTSTTQPAASGDATN